MNRERDADYIRLRRLITLTRERVSGYMGMENNAKTRDMISGVLIRLFRDFDLHYRTDLSKRFTADVTYDPYELNRVAISFDAHNDADRELLRKALERH